MPVVFVVKLGCVLGGRKNGTMKTKRVKCSGVTRVTPGGAQVFDQSSSHNLCDLDTLNLVRERRWRSFKMSEASPIAVQ